MIANPNRASVLIVDDEPNIRLMLRTALSSEGYVVSEASNGREAIEHVDRERPDLIVLDLSMPQMDGMGVLRALQDLPVKRRPRVIVITAHASVPAAVQAMRLGALDFVEKPVSPDEVRQSVAAALAEDLADETKNTRGGTTAAGGYAGVIDRARQALREAKWAEAESLLMKAADLSEKDATYFNLVGVLAEMQKQWKLARKFYGRAIAADGHHEAAQQNMQRIYELYQFGHSSRPVAMGDEPGVGHRQDSRRLKWL